MSWVALTSFILGMICCFVMWAAAISNPNIMNILGRICPILNNDGKILLLAFTLLGSFILPMIFGMIIGRSEGNKYD